MTSRLQLSVRAEGWPACQTFRVAGAKFDRFESIVVELWDGSNLGKGEGFPIFYFGQSTTDLIDQVESVRPAIERGADRLALLHLLPAGGARNALDCALWDLEAKTAGQPIWHLTGTPAKPLPVQLTIGLADQPEQMAQEAARTPIKRLKIKLDADRPVEKVRAIRLARPDAHLIVDANQAWTGELLSSILPELALLGIQLIEQPLPRESDAVLESFESPVPLCADESFQGLDDLPGIAGRYQVINIKLDKSGGLTHGFDLAAAARKLGLKIMVGCMGGGSLAIAPACVLAAASDIADLDGPLWQTSDRLPGLRFEDGMILPFGPEVWG